MVLVPHNLFEDLVYLLIVPVQLQPPKAVRQSHTHSETTHRVPHWTFSRRENSNTYD